MSEDKTEDTEDADIYGDDEPSQAEGGAKSVDGPAIEPKVPRLPAPPAKRGGREVRSSGYQGAGRQGTTQIEPKRSLRRAPKRVAESTVREAEMAGAAAARLRDQLNVKREAERLRVAQEDDRDYVYYIQCPEPNCLGPGIWIYRKPFGVLSADDWSASYKPRGMMWPTWDDQMPPIYCQCCWELGERVKLPTLHHNGQLVAHERHVRKILLSEYQVLTGDVPVSTGAVKQEEVVGA